MFLLACSHCKRNYYIYNSAVIKYVYQLAKTKAKITTRSKTSCQEIMSAKIFPEPLEDFEFRAVGLVRGKYIPEPGTLTKGTLKTDDGRTFPVYLIGQLGRFLKKHPEILIEESVWAVYPRTTKKPPFLYFNVKSLRRSDEPQQQKMIARSVDCFSIRGVIIQQHSKWIQVYVCRNSPFSKEELKKNPSKAPFVLNINGRIPQNAVDRFWDLEVSRNGNELVLEHARLIGKSPVLAKNNSTPRPKLHKQALVQQASPPCIVSTSDGKSEKPNRPILKRPRVRSVNF